VVNTQVEAQWQRLVFSARSLRVGHCPLQVQKHSANRQTGEIPSMKIFESDKTLAFLDINPLSLGHAVAISKSSLL
jgi:hypothetical protein